MKKILLTSAALMLLYAAQGQQHQIAVSTSGSVQANIQQLQLNHHELATSFNKWLGLNSDYSFIKTRSSLGMDGLLHETFQQYYKGYKVKGAQIIVHSKVGIVQSVNGRIINENNIAVSTNLSKDEAFATAIEQLGIGKVTYSTAPELLIAFNNMYEPVMVYAIRIDGYASMGKLTMQEVLIDPNSGKLLKRIPLMHGIEAMAKTLYSGTQKIYTEAIPGGYRLKDNTRKIHTVDVGGINPIADESTGVMFDTYRDITNETLTWNEKLFLMETSLSAVGSVPTFFAGLGINFSGFSVTGKLLTASIDQMVGTTSINLAQEQILDTAVSTILPASSSNLYLPLVSNMQGSYYLDSVELDLATFTLVSKGYTADQYSSFPIDETTAGTHTWIDAVSGNSGTYTIEESVHPAIDAHWGITKTYDYYKSKFDHDSYDKAGSEIKNYYNGVFYLAGTNNNAAALPAPYNAMVYGTGDGVDFNPFVTLDITGHEYTHLVINSTSNLEYQGESGALNESFADIMGVAIDFYARGAAANWTMGDSMAISIPYMRSMSDPNSTETFSSPYATPQPDTYKGRHWMNTSSSTDNGGVHVNSGVPNYWFYLLAEGGSGTNDKGVNYNVSPIGLEKAEKIAYLTFTEYLTETSQFIDAYHASIEVASTLYGPTSTEVNVVKDAWRAVNIPEGISTNDIKAIAYKITIYPNPSTGNIFIQNDYESPIVIDVYNMAGVRVLQGIKIQKGNQQINLSGLSAGNYVLQCFSDAGSFSHNIVLQ